MSFNAFSAQHPIQLPRGVRIVTLFVALAMAFAEGYFLAVVSSHYWQVRGGVIAFVSVFVGALYMFCFGLYLWWRLRRVTVQATATQGIQ